MLPSAMSSSMVGALLIHSDSRCDSSRQPSAIVSSLPSSVITTGARSDVGDTVGDLVERWVPVDLGEGRLEELVLVRGIAGDDVSRRHDPDRYAFAAAGVDVARVLDGHLRIDGVHAADMRVVQPVTAADEDLPQRPLPAHATVASLAARFAAWASAASRTHAPSSCARRRCASRCALHGPSPRSTALNSSQSGAPNRYCPGLAA